MNHEPLRRNPVKPTVSLMQFVAVVLWCCSPACSESESEPGPECATEFGASDGSEGGKVFVLGASHAVGEDDIDPTEWWMVKFATRIGARIDNCTQAKTCDLATGGSFLYGLEGTARSILTSQLPAMKARIGAAAPGDLKAVLVAPGGNDLLGACATGGISVESFDSYQDGVTQLLTELRRAIDASDNPRAQLMLSTVWGRTGLQETPLEFDSEGRMVCASAGFESVNEGRLHFIEVTGQAATKALLVDGAAHIQWHWDGLTTGDGLHLNLAGHRLLADVATNAYDLALSNDADDDGLSDAMEMLLGTDCSNPDSDADGCSDGEEFSPYDFCGCGPGEADCFLDDWAECDSHEACKNGRCGCNGDASITRRVCLPRDLWTHSRLCVGSLEPGQFCDFDAECASGHCETAQDGGVCLAP